VKFSFVSNPALWPSQFVRQTELRACKKVQTTRKRQFGVEDIASAVMAPML
jgi:hypothetical protein